MLAERLAIIVSVKVDALKQLSEADVIRWNRREEARAAGMNRDEADVFADSDIDIGKLRELVRGGCPPRLLAWILL